MKGTREKPLKFENSDFEKSRNFQVFWELRKLNKINKKYLEIGTIWCIIVRLFFNSLKSRM